VIEVFVAALYAFGLSLIAVVDAFLGEYIRQDNRRAVATVLWLLAVLIVVAFGFPYIMEKIIV